MEDGQTCVFIQQECIFISSVLMGTQFRKGSYSIERDTIKSSLFHFLSEVRSNEMEVIRPGLITYSEKNLDFIDCILYAYHKIKGYEIKTFDKKLKRLLQDEAAKA